MTPCLVGLLQRGVPDSYVVGLLDARREDLLARYPRFEDFAAGFEPDAAMLREVAAMGAEQGSSATGRPLRRRLRGSGDGSGRSWRRDSTVRPRFTA